MKHTKGEWKLRKAGTDECGVEHAFSYVVVAPKRYIDVEGLSDKEAEANAQLIASAPELLQACKEAYKDIHSDCTERGCSDLCEILHKAIAKAEGER